MERIYNKLVRDNIPNIIKEKGEEPITRILSDEEYKKELEKKLNEEYQEVLEANGSERVEELADILEVIKALGELEHTTLEEIINIATESKKNTIISVGALLLIGYIVGFIWIKLI